MSDTPRDTWGKWGLILALAIMAFASFMYATVGNLVLGLQRGSGSPLNLLFISLYGALAIASGLAIVWSIRKRQRWLESVTAGP